MEQASKKTTLFLIAVALLSGCGRFFSSRHDALLEGGGIRIQILDEALNARAMLILDTQCASCHGPRSSGVGGFSSVLDLPTMIQTGLVVTGSPDKSRLILRAQDGTMPPGRGLAPSDVDTLRQWIASGFAAVVDVPISSPTPASGAPANLDILNPALNTSALAILRNRCASCHDGGAAVGNFADVMDPAAMAGRGMLIPGNADGSKLFRRSSDGSMPPGTGLAAGEVQTLRDWITSGIALANGAVVQPSGPKFPAGATELTKQAVTLLYDRCASCHNRGSGESSGGGVLNAFDPAQLVISGMVKPGRSAQSPLYDTILRNRMPKSPAAAFTAAEKTLIRTWIDTDIAANPAPLTDTVLLPLAPTYASVRANILATRCVLCHGGSLGTEEGYSYATYTATLRSVRVGQPSQSKLYTICLSGEMPERFSRLSTPEMNALSGWISAGAPQN